MANISKPWITYAKPFKIFGNLYFAGNTVASSHIIDTGDGLILIDSGYPQTLYLLIQSIWELGFKPCDVKYIIHSHGHYDHLGATKALVELTGAKTFIGFGDEDYANGKLDLTRARESEHEYHEAFEADCIMRDNDIITLGNTSIQVISTLGHTPGTMSFFFDVTDGKVTYRAGMHGGVGTGSMAKEFLERYGLSFACRNDFLKGLEKVRNQKVDIFIGNHAWNNDTFGKYKQMQEQKENPFIDSRAWEVFLDKSAANLQKVISEE